MPWFKCRSFYLKLEELSDSLMAIEEKGAIIATAGGMITPGEKNS
jgi:hypothetical protein